MRTAYLILLYTTFITFAQSDYYSQKSSVFEISELIQGTWYLDKVEIIGLNSNDTSCILSQENQLKRIVFNSSTVECYPDTTEYRFYQPTIREFYYQLHHDTITDWTTIQLMSKRKKKQIIESYTVVSCSFNNLVYEVYEVYEVGNGLEKIISRTRYYYVRPNNFSNPLLGSWTVDKNNFLVDKTPRDSIYNLFKSDTIYNESNKTITKLNFINNEQYEYTCYDQISGVYYTGKYAIDFSREKLFFIRNNIVVFDYEIIQDGSAVLTFDKELTSAYAH
ncbi:MAG: hypothetical protein MK105_12530 [Crocinitomicaceae bacterium]|nr:hypothetical protein [Crocinitomicaceae bacterium]